MSEEVTKLPEMIVFNKYLGFYQLDFLNDNGINCVLPTEIVDYYDNIIINSPPNQKWSVRIAALTGKDFDLPSLIGAKKDTAIKWIHTKHLEEERYIFMCSEYFEASICGRIHIEKNKISIEASVGDFHDFKHNTPDWSSSSYFGFSFLDAIDNGNIDKKSKLKLIELSANLEEIYQDEIQELPTILFEFDFAFGNFTTYNTEDSNEDTLKIVSMRAYDLNAIISH